MAGFKPLGGQFEYLVVEVTFYQPSNLYYYFLVYALAVYFCIQL